MALEQKPKSISTRVEAPAEHRDRELVDRIREVVRFTIPYFGRIVVFSEGNADLVDLEGRQTWHFPQTRGGVPAGPYPNAQDAIDQIEARRSEGAEYLLIPATAFWWLDYFDAVRQHLGQYRVVHREEDACLIIALHDDNQREVRKHGTPDGLPLPAAEMLALNVGSYNVAEFLAGGERVTRAFREVLRANGVYVNSLQGILDFGCGCGRVIRQWRDCADAGLFGVDYNPYLVDWCSKAFPFASFQRNRSQTPLGYPDDSFELIYSYSVFTHLDTESQFFWMNELIRVLKPGGYLIPTIQGTAYVAHLPPDDGESFKAGEMVLMQEDYSGSSACSVYHPRQYLDEVLAPELTLIDFVPGAPETPGGIELMQDIPLLRKPS